MNRRFLKHIALDEDGVALAFGISFFLLIFLLGMSVYAAGETVRQRMELQNAADAAAYSAAVVQADTLSRVACINKAMSWTYVMLNRRCMDYIVDKWLEEVDSKWQHDFDDVQAWNNESTCGTKIEGVDYLAGANNQHKMINLNGKPYSIDIIRTARTTAKGQGKSYHALGTQIATDRATLSAMRRAEENLFSSLSKRIKNAVDASIEANISGTPNDDAAGGAGIGHVLFQNSYENYTETLPNEAGMEKIFLVYGGFRPAVSEISTHGVDNWWIRDSGGKGFKRKYEQKYALVATWNWQGTKWELHPESCDPLLKSGSTTVRGRDVEDGYFQTETAAKPFRLKKEFFGEQGVILVGVKRKLNNPFAFLFAGGQTQGLFDAFTVRDKRSMWAVAAARAAYSPPGSEQKGAYEATFLDVNPADSWNLCEADWDAVFLPVANAFDQGEERAFKKVGKNPLSKVYSKLSPGAISAPPGMTADQPGGGNFNLESREGLLH